jgi:hypothetical protein
MRVADSLEASRDRHLPLPQGRARGLRALVGQREEKVSLGTRDPRLARVLHAAKATEVEARWAGLRAEAAPNPVVKLTDKQEWALAGEIYRRHFAALKDNPGPVEGWETRLMMHRWRAKRPLHPKPADWSRPVDRFLALQLHGPAVDAVLAEHRLDLNWDGRQKLLRRVAEAI